MHVWCSKPIWEDDPNCWTTRQMASLLDVTRRVAMCRWSFHSPEDQYWTRKKDKKGLTMEFEHDFPYWKMIGHDGTLWNLDKCGASCWILRVCAPGSFDTPQNPMARSDKSKRMLRSSSWAFTALKSRSKAILESSISISKATKYTSYTVNIDWSWVIFNGFLQQSMLSLGSLQ